MNSQECGVATSDELAAATSIPDMQHTARACGCRSCKTLSRPLRLAGLLLLLMPLAACSSLSGARLLLATSFGMKELTPDVYVETETSSEVSEALLVARQQAAQPVEATFRSITSHVIIYVCMTERCYERFGGARGELARVYGERILLSPRGQSWHFLAHEWTHAEFHKRLTYAAWLRTPQWFDEGLAVAVSAAPEHSEEHWRWLAAHDVHRPTHAELMQLNSSSQWVAALRSFGETGNAERRARGEPEIRPVYAAAGMEVRPWLLSAGSCGVLHLIERVNHGAPFPVVYESIAHPDSCQE